MRRWIRTAVLLALLAAPAAGRAKEDPPAATPRIMPVEGEVETALIEQGGTLLDAAFDHRVGYEAVVRLNPGVDPWIPEAGTVVQVPTQYVLPDVEPQGLVINIPEMRLYDFREEPPEIYAAAVGDLADPSLIGSWKIGAKRENPAWRVPASIRAEKPELPAVVPPGPDNPLGSRWMTIGNTSYGVHGTNVRWSIGRTATHGCIRLYEDAIQRLYERTPTGTPLRLIYQPFKWGVRGGVLHLEVHPDLYMRFDDPIAEALRTPRLLGVASGLDIAKVVRVVKEARGVPVPVGRLPGPSEATSTPTS